jgi:hypothetical protein
MTAYERTVATGHAPARLARLIGLHWTSARRCGAARTPARPRRRRDARDRKGWIHRHGDVADPSGAAQDFGGRPVRRPHVCRWRQRQTPDQGIIREHVQAGMPRRPRARLGTQRAQDRGDPRGRKRRGGRRSSKRSSAGTGRRWLRITLGKPTGCGLPKRRCTSQRTMSELPFPYLCVRRGRQSEKPMNSKTIFESGAVERKPPPSS